LNGAHHIKVSSRTGEGLEELRSEVVRMLSEVRVVLDVLSEQQRVRSQDA